MYLYILYIFIVIEQENNKWQIPNLQKKWYEKSKDVL